MNLIYICSPLRGNIEKNIKKATQYCAYAAEQGVIPIAPHTMFTKFLDDTIPQQREKGLSMGLELLKRCDELWVCGDTISQGMQNEISYAKQQNIPTRNITQQFLLDCALKWQPDFLCMGEARGKEAIKAFEAIMTSHPTISTIHTEHLEQETAALKETIREIQRESPIFLTRNDEGIVTSVILPEEAREKLKPEEITKIEDYIIRASSKDSDPEPAQIEEQSPDIEMQQ